MNKLTDNQQKGQLPPIPTVTKRTYIRREIIFVIILSFIIGIFTTLTILAKFIAYFPFDLSITLFIQSLTYDWFDRLMRFITLLGNTEIVGSVLALLIIAGLLEKRGLEVMMLLVSVTGSSFLSTSLKALISRPRPDPDLINQVGKFIRSDSFPSGHVLAAVGLYGFLLFLSYTLLPRRWYRTVLLIIFSSAVFLMGPSRIYLGAHWFSDVLGAYLIGFIWLVGVIYLYNYFLAKERLEKITKSSHV